MDERFKEAIEELLKDEGGYVNDPDIKHLTGEGLGGEGETAWR